MSPSICLPPWILPVILSIITYLLYLGCDALSCMLLFLFTGLGCFPLPGLEVSGVSAAVSDESVAGDSGVYEATTQRYL